MGILALENWIHESGGVISGIEVRADASGDRGVFATRKLLPGETVLRIPNNLLITGSFARNAPNVAAVFRAVDDAKLDETLAEYASSDKDTAAIVLFLVAEVARIRTGQSSFWKPWIDTLPGSFHSPSTVPQELLDSRLNDSIVHVIASEIRAELVVLYNEFLVPYAIERFPEAFPPHVVTYELFLWAHSVTESRAFDIAGESVEGIESTGTLNGLSILTPYGDMLNHASDSKIVNAHAKRWLPSSSFPCGPENVGFQIVIGSNAVEDGWQIFISYGNLDNARLLLHYGFAEFPNPNDRLKLTLCEPDDETMDLLTRKQLLLGLAHGGVLGTEHELSIDNPLPSELLASVRLLSMTEEEASSATVRTDFTRQLSYRNEDASLTFLNDVLSRLKVKSEPTVAKFQDKYELFDRFCAMYMKSSQEIVRQAVLRLDVLLDRAHATGLHAEL